MDKNIYHVPYIYGKMDGRGTVSVRVPGSKSITNRALLLAMLADGPCTLTGALFSDDSRYLQQCIADLGFEIEADEKGLRCGWKVWEGGCQCGKPPFMWEARERRRVFSRPCLG